MDLREYIRILRRRKWVILVSFLVVFVSYVVTLLQRPVYYTSYSTIFLRDPTMEERLFSAFSGIGAVRVTMQTQLQTMGARSFQETVADVATCLLNNFAAKGCERYKKLFLDDAGKTFKDKITKEAAAGEKVTADEVVSSAHVGQVGETGMIRIDVSTRERVKATVIAGAYAEAAQQKNTDISTEQINNATTYIDEQLENYHKKLSVSENKLREFNKKEGVVDFDAEVLDRITRLSDYHVALEQLDMQEQEGKLLSTQIMGQLSIVGESKIRNTLIPNPVEEEYRRALFPMEMQLVELEEKYTGEHPKVAVLKKKIGDLKDRLKTKVSKYVEVPSQIPNPTYEYLSQQLVQQQLSAIANGVRRRAISSFIEKEQTSLSSLSDKQLQYARFLREKTTAERMALALEDMLERMRVAGKMKSGNAQILDHAGDAVKVSPFDMQKIAFMILVAFASSVFLGVVWELLDDTIKTPHDVKRYVNVPVLGTIPHVADSGDRLITKLSYKMPLCDAYNKVTFQMESLCLDLGYKSLLVTSAKSGEGKSTILANAGISLARNGERVILIDGDLRRPSLHKLLGVTNTVGLTSILTGELMAKQALLQISQGSEKENAQSHDSMEAVVHAALQPTEVEGLFVLTSGPLVSNPVGLLRRPEFKKLLDILKAKSDLVLFDSPPVMALIDAALLASHVDASVLIFDASSIKRKEGMMAKQAISNLKAKILGAILNNSMAEEEYYYYYYSSYYYGGDHRRRKSSPRKG